jgi:predicted  nucleic acid-binding Zn-ribbon protein
MTETMMQTLTEIEGTTQTLTRLEAEQSDLGQKMSLAANDADSASLISLAHRRNNLPIEILSEQIRLEQLLLLRDEQRLPQLQAEVAKLAEPIEPMRKKIADLQVEFNIASGNVSSANEDLRQTRLEIAERRRAIEALLAQARNVKIAPASLAMNGGR